MKSTPRWIRTAVLLSFLVPLFAFAPAFAAAFAPAFADEEGGWELDPVGGRLDQTFIGYFQPIIGAQTFQDRADAELSLGVSSPHWKAVLLPWAAFYLPYGVAAGTVASGSAKVFPDLKEGWIEFREPSWDVRVGNQIISWGAADRLNPTDLWNPVDLTDPFLSRKLPLLTARVDVHPAEIRWLGLEALFAPIFRQSRLPAEFPDSGTASVSLTDSRWLLPLPTQFASGGGAPVPLYYQLAPTILPSQAWQAGARLRLSPFENWDFALSYQNTVERVPRFHFTEQGNASDPALPITITVTPSYHREQVVGLDGVGVILDGKVSLRFEAAYHLRDNSDVPVTPVSFQSDLAKNDYVQAVAGLDYTLPWKILGTVTYFDVMGVVYQEIANDYSESVAKGVLTGVPDTLPWDRDGIFYMENRFSPRLKLGTSLIYSFLNQDVYLSSGLSARLGDHFNAEVAGDFFWGAANGFYGQFNDDCRIRATTAYVF